MHFINITLKLLLVNIVSTLSFKKPTAESTKTKIYLTIFSVFISLSVTHAHAVPIGMVFEGPLWSSNGTISIFGRNSTLNIQLDNGTDNISQSYDITSVMSAVVTSSTGTTLLDWSSTTGGYDTSTGAEFISTDASGQGLLTIGSTLSRAYWEFFDDSGHIFQLGRGIYTSWDSRLPDPYAWYHGNITTISAQSVPIPAPGTMALILLGFFGLYLNRLHHKMSFISRGDQAFP